MRQYFTTFCWKASLETRDPFTFSFGYIECGDSSEKDDKDKVKSKAKKETAVADVLAFLLPKLQTCQFLKMLRKAEE